MNHRIASAFGYIGSVAAASLAAALMSGNAFAEGPLEYPGPIFVGSLSRPDVQAQVLQDRSALTSAGSEWKLQQQAGLRPASDYTRQQARADYIAGREEVHAMTAEDSGSSYVAYVPMRVPANHFAASSQR